ncbi:MAG TPA: alpha/beta hydrolase domain-containing protein [Bryobacteraceae bacterium]
MPHSNRAKLASVLVALCLGMSAQARVIRIMIESRQTLDYAPNYEQLRGHFFGELDPANPLNSVINDIELGPRNARGKVQYSATFTLLLPRDLSKASGVLWYEVPNRGNSPLRPRPASDPIEAGHILLSSGWQGDLTPRPKLETIHVPIAKNRDGSAITGPVLARLSNIPAGSKTASLERGYAGLHYQLPATLDTAHALLTKQGSDDGEMIPVAAQDWAFSDCASQPFPGQPDPLHICLKNGFEAGQLYQLKYTAKDPLILGIGLAATRDIVSFFRYAEKDDAGTLNPVARAIRYAIAFGTSQSGNYIKTFLHLGFNQDEQRHIVWEGVNPNIAARQTPLNFRFAIPGGAAGLYEPGSEGVLWWSDYSDERRGRSAASLLDRCKATKTCPKIVETFGSSEFWGLRMSPGLVGTNADRDLPLPPNVRRYYFPGVTHGGGRGGFSVAAATMPNHACALPANPNSMAESLRALRLALTDWVVSNAEPPDSRYPTLAHADLVAPSYKAMGFPVIPGWPLPDHLINAMPDYDFGASFRYADMSGAISIQPPSIRQYIRLLTPKTDVDGNEAGGVPSPLHQTPLGTYLGWNVTADGYEKGRGCGFSGGFIPFARTKVERVAQRDPRLSLEERYGTHDGYVARVREAARRMVKERFLLQSDADRIVQEAESSAVLR